MGYIEVSGMLIKDFLNGIIERSARRYAESIYDDVYLYAHPRYLYRHYIVKRVLWRKFYPEMIQKTDISNLGIELAVMHNENTGLGNNYMTHITKKNGVIMNEARRDRIATLSTERD